MAQPHHPEKKGLTVSGKKNEPKPKLFWSGYLRGGVGVFHVGGGGGPKSSIRPSKPRETKLLGGKSQDFCRDFPGAPEKFEKKKFVVIFGPI